VERLCGDGLNASVAPSIAALPSAVSHKPPRLHPCVPVAMPPLGMHAYRLFSNENRQEVQSALKFDGKPAAMSDVAKVLGQKWRDLSEESKKARRSRLPGLLFAPTPPPCSRRAPQRHHTQVYLDQAGAAVRHCGCCSLTPPVDA
jgi:hypothetical protein